jgi:glycosyltransferase involved in cell wall biosynthesis
MKVLCVINSSNNGGAQKMIVALYRELAKQFPESKMVFLQRIESQYSSIEEASYLVDALKTPFDYLKAYSKLKTFISQEKPDVLISFLPLANIMTSIIGRNLGIKIRIASQRNPPYIYGGIVRAVDRLIGSKGYYTHNVCNSKSGYDAFSSYPESYKNRLHIINNCVDKPDLTLTKSEARKKFNISPELVVLTNVGRLHEQKNHEVIINAMKQVDNATLFLAGGGPLREQIATQIRVNNMMDRVVMLGDLEREDVRTLLTASDIFLIPSKYEGLSNALIEAMSYGLPIICSNIPSFTDFLGNKDGINGFTGLIAENSNWATEINKLIDNIELRMKYGELSKEHIKDLTAARMATKFIDLFQV